MAETDNNSQEEIIEDDTNTGENGDEGGSDNDEENTGNDGDGDEGGDGGDDDKGDDDKGDDDKNDDINPDDFTPETRGGKKDDGGDDDDDDDMDAEDRARIDKRIKKQMSPMAKKIQDQNDQIEVNDYILDNPEMKKYKPAILKYVKHDAYKNIPIKDIASIVAGGDMKKIGAKLERDATKKVKKSKSGGSSSRNNKGGGKFDTANASFKDMETEIARVKGQL